MTLRDESGPADDRQIARYLLGLLPDAEAERLDEASIADDEFAARLRIGEADLVDSYVRGALDGEMLKRFESHYLSSPRRREKVRFAVSFLRVVDRAAPVDRESGDEPASVSANEHDKPSQTGAPADDHIGRSKLVSWLMVAAALLAVTCGMLFQAARLRGGLSMAPGESTAPGHSARAAEQQPADQRAANSAAAALPSRPVQAGPMTALVLMPQTRTPGPIPTLAIPSGADRVAFELRLESNDFPRYEVGLEDPASNQVVWRSDPIAATSSGQTQTISVIVPARLLKPQHYSLAVTGRSAATRAVIGSYTFQVAPR